jgi:hypothetical protein
MGKRRRKSMKNESTAITPEQALEELRQKVNIRDQMGGALYYNILNDECCQYANKCVSLGCDKAEIEKILGSGTFSYIN